jgi:iron complex outermembrane receptor protein
LRGNFGGLNVDINAFNFKLSNSIVQRRTAGGGFQYLNAGNTAQKGIETNITYPLLQKTPFIERGNLWISHTYHRFNYKDFTKDTVDLSNKKIPGIPPHTLSTGIDLLAANGLLATVSYLFTDRTPLTDANNSYADSYSLLGARIGFQKSFGEKWNLKIIVGADNLLNEKYSLGNDVNGFGGRYFNAAPARNYFTSLMVQRMK